MQGNKKSSKKFLQQKIIYYHGSYTIYLYITTYYCQQIFSTNLSFLFAAAYSIFFALISFVFMSPFTPSYVGEFLLNRLQITNRLLDIKAANYLLLCQDGGDLDCLRLALFQWQLLGCRTFLGTSGGSVIAFGHLAAGWQYASRL